MKRFIINFVYFSERYFFLVPFRLTTVILYMTARWSVMPTAEKTDLIEHVELEMRLVIKRSSQ